MTDNYLVHFFLGKVGAEALKLCRWPQWEQCFRLFDELVGPFGKSASITSEQAYQIPLRKLKSDPPGTYRVTLKKVPGLARLGWNLDNNRKWSQKLEELDPYPIELCNTTIVSSTKGGNPELCILLGDQNPLTAADGSYIGEKFIYNQSLTISVSERLHAARSAEYWDDLVARLSVLIGAVRVGRATRPWIRSADQRSAVSASPMLVSSCLGYGSFTKRYDSLDFDDRFQEWTYLK
ncbi:MAG TPA: hypothetical protein VH105_23725 [Burkholderiales bacterium]|jgi:hypothetical protein|nr:hypothetical protein [Burkholderiales bacterium]